MSQASKTLNMNTNTKFPLITSSVINEDEIIVKMGSHLALLAAEQNHLIEIAKRLCDEDIVNIPKEINLKFKDKRKSQVSPATKRNKTKSRTTIEAIPSAKTFFRTNRKAQTLQTVQTPIDFIKPKPRNVKTLINSLSKPNNILKVNGISNETKKEAIKLNLQLNLFKNRRYFSNERFKLKSTTDDKIMFKRMYYEDMTKKVYCTHNDLNGREVLCQSHQISSYTPMHIYSNRRSIAKRFNTEVITEVY